MRPSGNVSVVIPTWNRAGYLACAVQSALAQTVPPLEVLVCDDGSTDGSGEIVRSIGDPRVRWLPGEHAGRPAVPRNRGIGEARGEWIAFLDSDDEWLPGKIEKQLSLAAKNGCRAACSNAYRMVPGKGADGLLLRDPPARVAFDDLLRVNHVVCSSALIEKAVVVRASGFPEAPEMKAVEDYALWLRVVTLTEFACSPEPLLRYNDDPSASLRGDDPHPDSGAQRARVLADFAAWAEGAGVPISFLERAARCRPDPGGDGVLTRLETIIRRLGLRTRA